MVVGFREGKFHDECCHLPHNTPCVRVSTFITVGVYSSCLPLLLIGNYRSEFFEPEVLMRVCTLCVSLQSLLTYRRIHGLYVCQKRIMKCPAITRKRDLEIFIRAM